MRKINSNLLLIPAAVVGLLLIMEQKSSSPYKKTIPLQYGCDYVKFIGTDDQIRSYIFRIRNLYLALNPNQNYADKINLVFYTNFIMKKLNKNCSIFDLTKDQAILLYTFLSFIGTYSIFFENFKDSVDQGTLNELMDAKTEELKTYLNINLESDEKFLKIINDLNKYREYYIL